MEWKEYIKTLDKPDLLIELATARKAKKEAETRVREILGELMRRTNLPMGRDEWGEMTGITKKAKKEE